MKSQLKGKDDEIAKLNERIIKSEYKNIITTKNVGVLADIKLPAKSRSVQTTGFSVDVLKAIAIQQLDLRQVEQVLESVRDEFAKCDGAGETNLDDKTSLN